MTARNIVRRAIEKGLLTRPIYCSQCGERDKRGRDGRTTIQGHHVDYTKPLVVEWLCAKCHHATKARPETYGAPVFGIRNGQAKLTGELVAMIRKSNESAVAIARRLGVAHSTVNNARKGIWWRAADKARRGG